MVRKEICIHFDEYHSITELPKEIQKLVDLAMEAAKKAYAPFSDFQVGAALELENGLTLAANNQENKAYPSGLCAERSLLFFANGNYPDVAVRRMVIVAFYREVLLEHPVYPCGACRQVMNETEERFEKDLEIWMIGSNKTHKTNSMQALLPLKFKL